MRLTRLACRDFMAFEEVDLDFTGLDSVVVVGENGSGKSALLDLITWTLFDRSRTSGEGGSSIDDHIRRGASETLTRVEFEAGGHTYVVTREKPRGKTGTLNLLIDGEDKATGHKQDDTFARIAGLIGLNHTALTASTFMVQRSAGSFIYAKPAGAKDLLVLVAQLERFRPWNTEAKRLRTTFEAEGATALARVREAEGDLGDEQEARDALTAADGRLAVAQEAQSLASDRITAAKVRAAEHAGAVQRHSDIEARETATRPRLEAIDRDWAQAVARRVRATDYLAKEEAPLFVPTDDDKTAALRMVAEAMDRVTRHRTNQTELYTLAGRKAEFERVLTMADEWDEKRASVPCGGEGIYAACRFLTGGPTAEYIEGARAELVTIAETTEALEFFPEAERELEDARVAVSSAERAATKAEYDARERERLTVAAKEAEAEASASIARLGDERVAVTAELERLAAERKAIEGEFAAIREAEEDLRQAQHAYEQAQALAAVAGRERAGLVAKVAVMDRARTVLAEWQGRAALVGEQVNTYRLLEQAFHRDGIPTLIIERLVPRIEEEANKVLAGLPGGFAVQLRTQRVTGAGTLADTLDIVILKAGEEEPIYMLSFGQRFRVDLALRLALGRVLAHRAGSTIDTLWLDEPLADLDERGREAVIETLAAVRSEFGLVVAVSHHAEFSDRFPARIEVEQEDGVTSHARLIA